MADPAFPPPWFLLGFGLAFGLAVGSFLNVVIHRLPEGRSLAWPGSHCPGCQAPIAFYDNLPLLSYLLLGGRCRKCGIRISARYPTIELLTGLVFAGIAWRYGLALETLLWAAFAAALIAAAGIDFDHHLIPDEISVGGLAVGLVVVPALHVQAGAAAWPALRESLLGALLGGGLLWSVGFAHARVATAMGRSFEHWPGEGEALPRPGSLDWWTWFPGLGFGDVKLLAMVGAFLGPAKVVACILASALAGLLLGLGWMAVTRRLDAPFGFAPAIALGAIALVLFPDVWP